MHKLKMSNQQKLKVKDYKLVFYITVNSQGGISMDEAKL